jgi:hypothetical protein
VIHQCKAFVEEYGDMVIALLAQSLSPEEVCSAIKVCRGQEPKHAVLIGE